MIKSIVKAFLLSVLMVAQVHFAYAQTATLLPNAVQQFFDKNGNPLSSGTVNHYVPNTTTNKTVWHDSGETTPWNTTITLNAAGMPPNSNSIYGQGAYRQIVKDKNGNLIWDQLTSSAGSGSSSGSATVGDGDAVGTIKPWAGLIAPAAYAFTYGQEFPRSSFPELFQAVTSTQSGTCASGSPTFSSLSDTGNLPVGAPLESICFNAGTTILSKTVSTITASSNAIITSTTTATFFPYGNGNGTTTFNLPDLRGKTLVGRTNMGGITASNLTSTYFGTSPDALNANGGNQSTTLSTPNLPAYTPAGTNGNVTVTTLVAVANSSVISTTPGGGFNFNDPSFAQVISVGGGPVFTGTPQGGTSTAFSRVQPSATTNWIIKTTPDSNPNTFFGVASLGGMQGIIVCGTGVSCSGNTITATGGGGGSTPAPSPTTLGGVFSSTAPANQFANGINNTGTVLYAQPAFTNLSGQATLAQLPTINTLTILSNMTGGSAVPAANTLSAIFDAALSSTQGSIIYRGASSWAALGPGTSGNCLQTSGAAANPVWGSCAAGGSPTVAASLSGNQTSSASGSTANFAVSGLTAKSSLDTVNDQLVILDNSTTTLKKATPGAVVSSFPTSAASFNGNASGSSGTTSNFTIAGLPNRVSVDTANDKVPLLNFATGALNYVTPSQLGGGGGGSVTSVGGLTGAVGVANGIGVSGSNIQTNFTQTGTGAVTQTIPTWMGKRCVTPWDFTSSTIDNGSTNAQPAIQLALNTGKCVYLPTPTTCYLVNSDLNMTSSQVIFGDGIGVKTLCVNNNAGFSTGLFNCNTAQPGNQFLDMRIVYTQASPTGSFTLSVPNGSAVGTVSAFAGSVNLAANQYLSDYNGYGLTDGFSQGTYITSLGTSTGGNGTINLSISNTSGHTVTRTMSTPDNLRPQLTQYLPTFKCDNSGRVVLQNLQVENAWTLGSFQNNSGGLYVDHVNASAYAVGFWIDGALDTVRVNNFHFWPFGAPSNSAIFVFEQSSKNKVPMVDYPVGFYLGRVDGLLVNEFLNIAYQAVYMFQGTLYPASVGGYCICNFTNSAFDSFNGVVQNAGIMNLSNSYFSLYTGPYNAYVLAGASSQANLSNIAITNQSSASAIYMQSCTACTFEIQNISFNNGGAIPNMFGVDVTAGAYSTLKVLGGYADFLPTSATIISAPNPSSGVNNLKFSNFNVTTTNNSAYTNPLFNVSTGWRYTITNNSVNDKGAGAGVFFNNTTDCYCVFTGNVAPGWTVSTPTPGSGYYTGNPH